MPGSIEADTPGPSGLGFAGLGAMGFGMVSNLLQKGFHVRGFDVSPNALERLSKIAGTPCTSCSEAAHGQNKFFIMVATPAQADSVIFGLSGIVESLPERAIICLFSTVPPSYITSLPQRLKAAGRGDLRVLDCPVSGGFVGAASGELSIMMGGDKNVIEAVQPELQAISKPGRLFTTGDLGSASTIKMINQHLAGIHIAIAAETLAFAKALGLSARQAQELLLTSEGASWMVQDRGDTMLAADWSPKSAVDIFIKDLGIVCQTADDLHLPCPVASAAAQLFMERSARGHGRDDDASVVCLYEDVTRIPVCEPESPTGEVSRKTNGFNGANSAPELAFITTDDALHQMLSGVEQVRVLSYSQPDQLKAFLDGLSSGAVVGFDDETLVATTERQHSGLHFFDFAVLKPVDVSSSDLHRLIFTNSHHAVQTALNARLGHAYTITPMLRGTTSSMAQVVNLASLMHAAAAAENYTLATAAGASVQMVFNLINGAAGSSAQFSRLYPKMINRDATVGSDVPSLDVAEASLRKVSKTMTGIGFPGWLCNGIFQIYKAAITRAGPDSIGSIALLNNI